MSQLIVCQNSHGIILAADSKAVALDMGGEITHMEVDRMLKLSDHTAILTGGAAEGRDMIVGLKKFLEEEGLDDVQEVYEAALPFLATQFERFMRKECEVIPLDPIHQVQFVLGGYTGRDPHRSFRLYLLWTKRKLPKLDGDEISIAYTAPRLMGLEYKLNRLCQANTLLEDILPQVKKSMEERARRDDEVGGPFRFAFITTDGYKEILP
jgi:20S proteasome alpha/beta subunit